MDEQWTNPTAGPSNSSTPLSPGTQLKSPSLFPRSHFYTDGSDSGEDSQMLRYMGPSSSEDNFNSQIMVDADEAESEVGTASRMNLRSGRQTEIEDEIASFEATLDDQSTLRLSRTSDASNSEEESVSAEPRHIAGLGKAPMREEGSDQSVSTAGYQGDMSTTLDRFPSSASSSRRNTTSSGPDRRPSYHSSSSRRPSAKSSSSIRRTSTSQVVADNRGITDPAYSSHVSSEDETPTISRSSSRRPPQQHFRERDTVRNEFIVPRWQPDSEVAQCPICYTVFGWLNRKHHCRKCGRVVCNSCSPHRITIPYPYIVQPPDQPSPYSSLTYNRLLDPEGEGRTNNALEFGGGDRVRLCNPCVPDPNVAPPQTNQTGHVEEPQPLGYHGRSQSSVVSPTIVPGSLPSESRFRPADHRSRTLRESSTPSRNPQAGASITNQRTAEEFQNWYRDRDRANIGNVQSTRSRSSTVAGIGRDTTEDMHTFLRNTRGPSPQWRNTSNARASILGQRYNMSGEDPRTRPLPERPRLSEADECPVCHNELPSSSLPNFESAREAHIMACIEGASPTPTRSLPIIQPSSQSSSSRVSNSNATNDPTTSTTSFQPPRRTGVFPYTATEKDCQDDAECQICLEEYEPGVQMGRLECFCKFHLACIRQWFEKHPGRCPMHQHDEYGY